MRLAEIDGKALLRRHGLAVPRSVLLRAGEAAPADAVQWPGHLVKAQVLEGGRGKRGLVHRLGDLAELAETRRRILAALDDADVPLLLEEAVPIARELYLAVRIDGTRQGLELLVAGEGGEEVETTTALLRIPLAAAAPASADILYPDLATLFARDVAGRLARYAARLPEIAGMRISSSSRSTRSRSPPTGGSSPATRRSFATTAPPSVTIRTSFR
jgi:succinyl-CoA synthetase beta subunit